MKKTILKLLLFSCLLIAVQQSQAQGPPDPPGDPSAGGNVVVGGSAPVGNGLGLLLTLGLLYGAAKYYQSKPKASLEE